MSVLKKLLLLIFAIPVVASCTRDYEAPPIPEPTYNGKANISIAELKQLYASTKADAPVLIDVNYVLKAYVTGNDESGNIYKQLYIQDESGAINIGVDQNSVYTKLNVGQEVFVKLHGLSMVSYGGELQIGYTGTNANRIPWEVFEEHVFLNGWPNIQNATPTTVKISELKPGMVNMLVRLEKTYFVNGGKNSFTSNNTTTNEVLKDGDGKSIDVRTSSFASFAAEKLPSGSGTVIGVLGRFNGAWQLVVRSMDDIIEFGGEIPKPTEPEQPSGDVVIFNETFGTGTYPSGNRPKIADFTDFDMKAPITFVDATTNADIRSISGDNGAHVWLPAAKQADLTIAGINTAGKSNLVLTYQVAASLYDDGAAADLNAVTVKVNGTSLSVPSKPVSKANGDNNIFYKFTFNNIPAVDNLTVEFSASATANTIGLRLDNIKIVSAK